MHKISAIKKQECPAPVTLILKAVDAAVFIAVALRDGGSRFPHPANESGGGDTTVGLSGIYFEVAASEYLQCMHT